ncbi:MAG: hypothetical protein EBU34_10710 [Alphaproteobacteria bacterium]|nr:hypothetical protein [Alphaproteobacteria bacterium]
MTLGGLMQKLANWSLCCVLLSAPAAGIATPLVTKEEMLASQNGTALAAVDATPANPLAPQILVTAPDSLERVMKNPFNMEILLKAQKDAELNFGSFKAYYGTFRLDITERLLKEAAKTLTGLKLSNLEVPAGKHKIVLRISDTQGRTAEKEIIIKVE